MIDRRFVLLFVMTVCYQGHGEKLSQTESSSGFSAHVTRWVLPSWQRMMGWLKIALPLLVVGVVTKEQRCFTRFYSVLFVFSYFCYVELPFFSFLFPFFWIQETQKTNYYFMHLLWIIKFFCICICQYYIICILYWSVFMSDTEFEWILSSSCKPERERERGFGHKKELA